MDCPVNEITGYKRTGLKLRPGLLINFLKKLFGHRTDEGDAAKIDPQLSRFQVTDHGFPRPVYLSESGAGDPAFQLDRDNFRIFTD